MGLRASCSFNTNPSKVDENEVGGGNEGEGYAGDKNAGVNNGTCGKFEWVVVD